jgi:hypothetical protein
MSLDSSFGSGHTVDIGDVVGPDAAIQGVLFQKESCATIDGESSAIFRIIGITREEMEYKIAEGSDGLVAALRAAAVYPHTLFAAFIRLPQEKSESCRRAFVKTAHANKTLLIQNCGFPPFNCADRDDICIDTSGGAVLTQFTCRSANSPCVRVPPAWMSTSSRT